MMKRIFSLGASLWALLGIARFACAETAGAAGAAGTADAAGVAAADAAALPFADLPLFTKGLIASGLGLLGVFLILCLFYLTIRLMQRIRA